MITLIQLQPFCSSDPTRPTIAHPLTQGGHTYATDGRVVVRTAAPLADAVEQATPDCSEVFGENPPAKWFTVPEVRKPAALPCRDCAGEGKFPVTVRSAYSKEPHETHAPCPWCDGTSVIVPWDDVAPVTIGPARFAARYLYLIRESFPDAEIGPAGPDTPAWLRFPGGDGRLMPLRK